MNRVIKRTASIIITMLILLAIAYGCWYAYIVTRAIFTYQCKIYDGSGFNDDQKQICADYNIGGVYKVLTN